MRTIAQLVVGLALGGVLAGCLADIPHDCDTDADCGPDARCVNQGVRICVAADAIEGFGGQGGDAGSGGAGGDVGAGGSGGAGGGDGGSGGAGGHGGVGGSGGEAIDVGVTLAIHADADLAARLAAHPRTILSLAVRVDGGREPVEDVVEAGEGHVLAAVGEGPAVEVPVVLRLPAEGEVALQIAVEVEAALAGEGTARFGGATGALEFSMPTDEPHVAVVEVGLDPDFDFDGDLTPDAGDCAPDDPAIHPAAVDVCGGADADCNPGGGCIVPLQAGQLAQDLACDAAGCAVATDSEEGVGAIVRVDAELASSTLYQLVDPRAVALNAADGNGATVIAWDEWPYELTLRRLSSVGSPRVVAPLNGLGKALAISRRGKLGFAMNAGAPMVEVFDAIRTANTDITNCKVPPAEIPIIGDLLGQIPCAVYDLGSLSIDSKTLGGNASAIDLAVRQPASGNAQLYVMFADEPRIAVAIFESDGKYKPGASGLLVPFAAEPAMRPLALALSGDETRLYVAAEEASEEGGAPQLAVIATGNTYGVHATVGVVPLGVECPSALAVRGNELLVADRCRKEIRSFALGGDGLPTAHEPMVLALPEDCAPMQLGLLGSGATALPVATCEGVSHLSIHGAD